MHTKKTKRNSLTVKVGVYGVHRGMVGIYITASHFLEKTAHIIFINNISFLSIAIPEAMQKQEIVLKRGKNNKNSMDCIL